MHAAQRARRQSLPAAAFQAAAALRAGGRRRAHRRGCSRPAAPGWLRPRRCSPGLSRGRAAARRDRAARTAAGAESHIGRAGRPAAPARRRPAPISSTATARCWRRRSTARRSIANPKQILDAGGTRRSGRSAGLVLPQLNPPSSTPSSARARALSGSKRAADAAPAIRGQPARHSRARSSSTRSAASIRIGDLAVACRRLLRHRQ